MVTVWWLWSTMAICAVQSLAPESDSNDPTPVAAQSHHMINSISTVGGTVGNSAENSLHDGMLCGDGEPQDIECESCCGNVPETLLSADQPMLHWLAVSWIYTVSIVQAASTSYQATAFDLSSQHSPPDIYLWVCRFLK